MLGFVTDGQFPAPFCTPPRKKLATVFRGHTGTESVLVPSLAIAGLKCTFHGIAVLMMIFLTELQS